MFMMHCTLAIISDTIFYKKLCEQVGNENLHTNQNEYDTSQQLWFQTTGDGLAERFVPFSVDSAQFFIGHQ